MYRNVILSFIGGMVLVGSVACGGAATASSGAATTSHAPVAAAKCTDAVNYRIDPRGNAEINSIGEQIGACPTPNASPVADTDLKCTDQIDYPGDPRSNAEINSIGESTRHCPVKTG